MPWSLELVEHLHLVHGYVHEYDGDPCQPSEVGVHNRFHSIDKSHDRDDLSTPDAPRAARTEGL